MSAHEQIDPAYEQLAQVNDDLIAANAALVTENDRLRGEIRRARLYAGEHLPAKAGTGIIHILEQSLQEAS